MKFLVHLAETIPMRAPTPEEQMSQTVWTNPIVIDWSINHQDIHPHSRPQQIHIYEPPGMTSRPEVVAVLGWSLFQER